MVTIFIRNRAFPVIEVQNAPGTVKAPVIP